MMPAFIFYKRAYKHLLFRENWQIFWPYPGLTETQ